MNAMTERQRVGQLFMASVNASGASKAQLTILRRYAVGSVMLMGHTDIGVDAVRKVTDRVQSLAPTVAGSRVGLLVSTDQEGGQVQVLNGPGFSAIPAATTQGRWPSAQLQQRAAQWGRQLKSAGVGVDLAPVADIVPRDLTSVNQPIGRLDREYGNDASTAARQSTAVVKGFDEAGIYATLKHYPSLGQVRGNTDFSANVTDDVTTRDGTFLVPYRSGIDAGARFVMASTATYTRIDPGHQAVFSPTLLKTVLRGTLGFQGIVISDDLGKAVSVKSKPPGDRAVGFLQSGGDLVLNDAPSTVAAMASAVLSKASGDAGFRAGVDASVKRVLAAKLDAGGLSGCQG
ncbi:glycoside hydrolase family 3 N-terminal domain-containing protein [Streptantibioticus silvisoli]|uniref:beta-N-acetylhexosaminidase n=1 Tax=Streptantibioticus silvisoli TaxID=2705255 RepID=A0ABT6W641_9ACTN|nr:glycoside hydrolase family 3 N-terminal domain-containing protein [Streptantibioticus silvisoli]MDI5966211.1 glycoside hydrolase family 3 N-terminal domain-containing protein [Streptantibioticus silvisoli]